AAVLVAAGGLSVTLPLTYKRYIAGLIDVVVADPVVRAAGRSLYALSQRWAVLVPAGIVLKDPLTLVDPVLFPRERIASLRPLPFPTAPADDVLDLRLGAAAGSLVLELPDEAPLYRPQGRVRGGEAVQARR